MRRKVCRVLIENHGAQIHERRIFLERPSFRLGILLKLKKKKIGCDFFDCRILGQDNVNDIILVYK